MTYSETLKTIKELNIDPLKVLITDECESYFDFETSEEEFEKLCQYVDDVYNTSGPMLTVHAIVMCIVDMRCELWKDGNPYKDTIEMILNTDLVDFANMAYNFLD